MEITVTITDTTPVPRVLNVRQYSTGVDRVNFIVTGCSITGEVSACIKSNELMQELTVSRDSEAIHCLWEIASDFTEKSGCFDVQLRLTSGVNVWVSDRLLLIVSESTEGKKQAENIQLTGDYTIIDPVQYIHERLLLDMIIEKIEEE